MKVSKDYAEAMSSMLKFLITENDRMANDLQEARQRIEQPAGSTMTEVKKKYLLKYKL